MRKYRKQIVQDLIVVVVLVSSTLGVVLMNRPVSEADALLTPTTHHRISNGTHPRVANEALVTVEQPTIQPFVVHTSATATPTVKGYRPIAQAGTSTTTASGYGTAITTSITSVRTTSSVPNVPMVSAPSVGNVHTATTVASGSLTPQPPFADDERPAGDIHTKVWDNPGTVAGEPLGECWLLLLLAGVYMAVNLIKKWT